jgi:tRNA pseudouridine13 synthase
MHPTDPMGYPCLTADLPGVGGVIKRYRDDFVVEEIARYEPAGTGTHTYVGIEKDGLTTWQAVRAIARAVGRDPRDIGYAGLKDAHAITRQTLSIEHVEPGVIERLDLPSVRVLWTARHTNKLKVGHLRGNRFVIRIRETQADSTRRAEEILEVLTRRGVPNYFGAQRFGARGDNAAVGAAMLRGRFDEAIGMICAGSGGSDSADAVRARERFEVGDYRAAADAWPPGASEARRLCLALHRAKGDAERAWRAVDRKLAQLYLSAFQSELFNRVVAARIKTVDRLRNGDLAWKHANGAVFLVDRAEEEQPRCDGFEISPTGPLFGRKMRAAQGEPGRVESRLLTEAGFSMDTLGRDRRARLEGARRPLRFQPTDWAVEAGSDRRGAFIRVAFTLEPGCYATTLMREICKSEHVP